MAKKNDGTTTTTPTPAKVRKSTAGIPRVTNKVLAMDEAARKEWLDKVPAAHKGEVEKRLNDLLKDGRKGKTKKIDFTTIFNGRTVEELTEAQNALNAALAAASETEEAEAEAELEKLRAKIAAIKEAKAKAPKINATVAA
jgi:hypothetical protein